MIIVVPDTNILISATFWKGPPYEITRLAIQKKIVLCISQEIIEEYAKILHRDFQLNSEQIKQRTAEIMGYSTIVKPAKKTGFVKADPEDNKIVDAAIGTGAKYIISGDHHLLDIIRIGRTEILTARQFLNKIKNTSKP